jgi:two-component system, NtrC family, sensor kinase
VYADQYCSTLFELLTLYQSHYPQPVAPIQTALEAADLEFIKTDLPQILASMQSGADRIKQIVLSLRNFARMDEADYKPVDIHEGIKSALMILGSRLAAQNHRPAISVVTDYAALPPVECYAGQLNQVLMNILINAIDALETSAGEISITTQQPDAKRIRIRIADNGDGISREIQPQIFNPFFTTKAVGKGTGMGLAIGYQIIVEKHGGELTCHSTTGFGSEFVITIPIHQ